MKKTGLPVIPPILLPRSSILPKVKKALKEIRTADFPARVQGRSRPLRPMTVLRRSETISMMMIFLSKLEGGAKDGFSEKAAKTDEEKDLFFL